MKELKGGPFEPFDGEIGPLGCGMPDNPMPG